MADLQTYRFESERVPNPEDSESENGDVNDRLEGTFWCSYERCQIITTQRECVCCREKPEEENKNSRYVYLEFRQQYSDARRMLNSLLGVWIS